MAILTQAPPGLDALSAAAAALMEHVRPSVVAVQVPTGGHGAGVVWRADGLIVTNAHVAHTEHLEVILAGGRCLSATRVAHDPALDLAVLRVEASGLTAARIGDSDALRVGQLVFAMGHPLGEPHAAAVGIVCAAPGAVRHHAAGSQHVQADLTLYPGNSGGPLVDANGAVVGVNSMVQPPRLALAVPSRAVVAFLAATTRGRLGVRARVVRLPPPLVQRLGLAGERALIVVEVMAGEPAAAAGLLPGDVLLAANGQPLVDPAALTECLVAGSSPLRLTLLRGGAAREVSVAPRSAW